MFQLVADIHLSNIGSLYWQNQQRHAPCRILKMSVNRFSCCIFGNQGIVLIFAFIPELLTAVIGKYTMYQRLNTDCKLIDIASCKASKNISLVDVENVSLIR